MEKLQYGQIIISKAGRDKNKLFIIIDFDEEYVYVVDGYLRRIENPKKKKIKHIQTTKIIIEAVKNKIENQIKLTNADVRKELIVYQKEPEQRKEV